MQNIKLISTVILSALMFLSCACTSPQPEPVTERQTEAPAESTAAAAESIDFSDASETAGKMGIGINLGNTMEAYEATGCEQISFEWIPTLGENTPSDYETCWGEPVTTKEMIDGMRDAGFSTVRIPVFWGNMMENDGTWTINSDYIARVREIVDLCLDDGLYAVVNIHHFDEFIIRRNELSDCERIFDTLWTQIAEYFKDYPEKLVFEGFNEYLGGDRFSASGRLEALSKTEAYLFTNTLNKTFVDAVRATGGNNSERVLIISGYWTNIDNTTSDKFIIPEDSAENKLMVSVHYVDNAIYWQNQIGGQRWLSYIDDQCSKLERAFTSRGIPVFLGETTSVYPKSNFAEDAKYKSSSECLQTVLEELTDRGFVPVLWDTGGFYLRNECRIRSEEEAEVIRSIAGKLGGSQ